MQRGVLQRLFATGCLCGLLFATEASGVWLDVPFVKQERNGCGAASVAMVMQYWQRQQPSHAVSASDIDAEQIERTLYSERAHGIYASALEHYVRQHGFRSFAFAGNWSDLRQQLEKGRPLIVALKPSSGSVPLHYVVIVGLDWEQQVVLVNDPTERKLLKRERTEFERQWKEAGNWTMLAVPHTGAEPSVP